MATQAVSITPLDVLVASGTSYFGVPVLPYVPGMQGVGRLVSDPEQRVWFTTDAGIAAGQGSLAQFVAVPASRMWTIPVEVPDETVAGLGLSAVAAHGVLRRGGLIPGGTVLVLGAGGVVGQVAVQLAKAWGAQQVVGACRGAQRASLVSELGADLVVDIEGMNADQMAAAFTQAIPDGVDLVVDPVWGAPAQAAAAVLRPGGRLVNLGDSAGPTASFASAMIRSRRLEILGYTNLALTWDEQTAALGEILRLVQAGSLRMEPEVVAADQATEGWQRQATGQARSRVVVRVT